MCDENPYSSPCESCHAESDWTLLKRFVYSVLGITFCLALCASVMSVNQFMQRPSSRQLDPIDAAKSMFMDWRK